MAIGVPSGWVVDYSLARPGAAVLKAAGCTGVMRYIAPGRTDGAQITSAEIADFDANSLPYGLVMEFDAQWLLRGYNAGVQLAQSALAEETSLGIPRGVTYMACDFDIQPSQYAQALDTLHGLSDGYGGWQYIGVYGSKSFCEWVGANSPAVKFWSTDAWSNYTPAANAVLHQHAQWPQGVPVVQGCDHNLILGDWAPRTGDDLTPDEHNVLYTSAKAIIQLAGVLNQLVNDEATRWKLQTHGDAGHYSMDQLRKDVADVKTALANAGSGPVDAGAVASAVVDGVKGLAFKAS